jgi:uncharacterized repeat protein (TIGR03803 family)
MQSQAQRLISLFRTIVLAAVTALLITSAALSMPAQNSVPPTVVQAGTPQFAVRLAHPTRQPASRPNPALIYDNGPINGNTYAWAINFGFVVSDTITVNAGAGYISGMAFGAWLSPGDTLTSADVSITSEPNDGTTYFYQTVNFTQQGCTTNADGFNVCTVSASFNGPMLNAGTYWVNLQNARDRNGDPVYWDQNSGVGCQSPGCPSQAQDIGVGTIPSESFSIEGANGPPQCFQSGGNLQILSSFTQQQAGGTYSQDGVTIDRAGNLYGALPNGGNNGAGFAFKLTHVTDWLLDPLFSFFGGNSGGQPTGVIVGPNGSLYGGALGGIQNCGSDGSQYCGLVFNLRPQPTACRTALCSWAENVPYRFSSESDGSGTINVSASDQEGNLYGTTSTGGAYDAGTVFELTPSGGGWTKTTLYSFTGGADSDPTQVLVGNDGNLYGVATGMVFQLTPSGGQWTESVLHMGFNPANLVQDSAGNLYGTDNEGLEGLVFVLQKSSGWAISEYGAGGSCQPEDLPYDFVNNLTIDAAGNLYGTGGGGETFAASFGKKSPGGGDCSYTFIFKARYASDGWHYQNLDFLLNTLFPSGGNLALDTSGNLYGTTDGCGTYGYGTVWQVSP